MKSRFFVPDIDLSSASGKELLRMVSEMRCALIGSQDFSRANDEVARLLSTYLLSVSKDVRRAFFEEQSERSLQRLESFPSFKPVVDKYYHEAMASIPRQR